MGEVETVDQGLHIGERLDGLRTAEAREQGGDAHGFEADVAEMSDAQRAEALGQLALAAGQQRFMGEGRELCAERGEHLDLGRGVGDMILATQHMGDAHGDIVDDRGEHVEPRTIGAADDRVGQQFRVEALVAADQVGPGDRLVMVQLEAPVRRATLGFIGGDLVRGQRQGGAVIDRRQAAPEQDLAAQVQFLARFIGGVDMAGCLERFEPRFIEGEAVGLFFLAVPMEAEPLQVGFDRIRIFGAGAFEVGIIKAQQELATGFARPQPIMERGADIADMEIAGGRRGEAGDDGHYLILNPSGSRQARTERVGVG